MKILLACPVEDKQSGIYLNDALIELGHKVAIFDWREITNTKGVQGMNKAFMKAHDDLEPDLTIIIKGLGIEGFVVKEIKKNHKTVFVNWMFDVRLAGIPVTDVPWFVNLIKEMDLFYTIDDDAVKEFKELGVDARWLSQGCAIEYHKEAIFNSVQGRRFGSDVVFLGSVGGVHNDREKMLSRIHDEGFDFKLYGYVYYPEGQEPDWVAEHHTGFEAINDMHSLVCGASKIVIGNDAWNDRSKGFSVRNYKVLCAGGFLLTSHTKDIESVFTPGEHLAVYDDEDDLIEKIIYYLNNDEERERIAKAGQKLVMEQHTYTHRLKRILADVEEKTKHLNS